MRDISRNNYTQGYLYVEFQQYSSVRYICAKKDIYRASNCVTVCASTASWLSLMGTYTNKVGGSCNQTNRVPGLCILTVVTMSAGEGHRHV